ncbi:DUF3048 domain-containing protein [Candidatus Peregrinibacteria bacterium]|nr:DUF3048 domain-containing protein [Candidatus Peregrinibacteria bacterium]
MRKIIFISVAVGVAIMVGFGVFLVARPEIFSTERSFFERFPFSSESKKFSMPIGVMIENEIMARPFQKGLSQADIVYEAPTEGDITRFLAVFLTSEYLGKIGPIRSARPYFLDWMNEYKGLYVHVGGSNAVLRRLGNDTSTNGLFNVDQFYYEKYFWRENVRKTALEHTMFTTFEVLNNLITEQKLEWLPSESQLFGGGNDVNFNEYPAAKNISINFGAFSYTVQYEYDSLNGLYLRSQVKKPHIDQETGMQISAGAVVIQFVKAWDNGDLKLTISIKTVGEGDALIFANGHVVKAKWKKASPEEKTRFFDEKGEEIKIPDEKGPVWLEIVPIGNKVTYE